MAIRIKPRPLQEKIAFKANQTRSIEIPQDNDLRGIILRPSIDLTKGATGATATIADGILNAMKKVRLVMDGDDNKFNVDAVKAYKVESAERGVRPTLDALPATVVDTTGLEVQIIFDFANFRQDLSDISALLPAPDKSSLDLEIDWGSIADLYGTVNNSVIAETSTVQVTLLEAIDDEGKSIESQAPNGKFDDIREGVSFFDFTQQFDSFDSNELTKDIKPTPHRILTTAFLTREDILNAAPASRIAASDIITRVKVDNVKNENLSLIHWIAKDLQRFDVSQYGLTEGVPTGFYYLDWIEIMGGLDNFVTEALKWKFLTNAPASGKTDRIELFLRWKS